MELSSPFIIPSYISALYEEYPKIPLVSPFITNAVSSTSPSSVPNITLLEHRYIPYLAPSIFPLVTVNLPTFIIASLFVLINLPSCNSVLSVISKVPLFTMADVLVIIFPFKSNLTFRLLAILISSVISKSFNILTSTGSSVFFSISLIACFMQFHFHIYPHLLNLLLYILVLQLFLYLTELFYFLLVL